MSPFKVDASGFTLGEFAVFEELTGMNIPEVLAAVEDETGGFSPSFLIALTTVTNNRVDPSFTVADAAELTLQDLEAAGG